jgi:hypothetical protein
MSDLPDEIFDIDAPDPIRAVVEIERRLRPDGNMSNDYEAVYRYYEIIKYTCSMFGVNFSLEASEPTGASEGRRLLYLTRLEIDKMRIGLLGERLQFNTSVILDENWRDKIHSYLSIIRKIVQDAGLSEQLRESILDRLHALDAAVDQTRTPIQKFSDVLVSLCEAVSAGADALKPAVTVLERILGAVARLRSQERTLALPPPENYGLKAEGAALPPDEATEA